MQISRDHHTVPRLLLRGFTHKKTKQLLARKRDGSEILVSLNDATVVPDFYNIGDGQTPDATLEDWFSNSIESPVGETMGAFRKGALPTGPARITVATFVALQMVRTMLRAPVAGMRTERVDIKDVTGVPLEGDTEGLRFLLDTPAAIARIEDERLDVGGEVKDAVHMGFDVVVERVMRLSAWDDGWVSIGELGQGVPVVDPKVLRLEDAVRIAKRGPRECVRGKPDVR